MKYLVLLIALSSSLFLFGQNTIAEIQGQTAISPFKGQVVSVKGIVTAAKVGAGYFIQDGDSAWSGIYVYDTARNLFPAIGDSVLLTATVDEYYDFTELKTITSFQILSSNNRLPQPLILTANEVNEAYEGVLVTVNNVTCTNSNLGYGEWEVSDETGSVVINDLFYAYMPTETESYSITGTVDYSFSAFKIEPFSEADIVINAPTYFTVEPFQSDASKSSITINWETNSSAISVVEYGKTEELEKGKIENESLTTRHQIELADLESGEIYYVKAYSVVGTDTTLTELRQMATVSNSTGTVEIAFNKPEVENEDLTTKLISYINKAESSLDIAIYDVENWASISDARNQQIFDAVLTKAASGVQVRVITDDLSTNDFFTNLAVNAKVVKGNSNGIMHHKFVVVDAESVENSWLITGSVNWTYNNLVMDYNNLIAIQDQSLAKAFSIEFNEMWGSAEFEPKLDLGKFSADKADNTPHYFEINAQRMELYFSPSDNTESKIVEAIDSASATISFCMMAFTSDAIGAAIIRAKNRGVEVKGIIDYVDYSGSEFTRLLAAGIEVDDFVSSNGLEWPDGTTVHHKFVVIDAGQPNALVISGTHNWTASAESKNDENTLFIYDNSIAEMYLNEFEQIKAFIHVGTSKFRNESFEIWPNPVANTCQVRSFHPIQYCRIISIDGKILRTIDADLQNNIQIDLFDLAVGTYLVEIMNDENQKLLQKIVKQ